MSLFKKLGRAFSIHNIVKNVQGALPVAAIALQVVPGVGTLAGIGLGALAGAASKIGSKAKGVLNAVENIAGGVKKFGSDLTKVGQGIESAGQTVQEAPATYGIGAWIKKNWLLVAAGLLFVYVFFFRHHSPSRFERMFGGTKRKPGKRQAKHRKAAVKAVSVPRKKARKAKGRKKRRK